jgi:hypothetical protein
MTTNPIGTNPIGLTRAEEEREQQRPGGPRVVVAAPPGAVRCRMSVPPNGDDCPAAAVARIVWPGEPSEPTPACLECVQRTTMLAHSHRCSIRVLPLDSSA